jgi:uncharacterized protein YecA (UPF0149 family)
MSVKRYTCDLCGKRVLKAQAKMLGGNTIVCLKCYDGRKPSLIASKNTPRNSKCPCGSGKKYKSCCMRSRVGG